MYIIENKKPRELHPEQGYALADKKNWESFTPTENNPENDTYRFSVAYLPQDITIELCQERYVEVSKLE